jgi:hypothetical protein
MVGFLISRHVFLILARGHNREDSIARDERAAFIYYFSFLSSFYFILYFLEDNL